MDSETVREAAGRRKERTGTFMTTALCTITRMRFFFLCLAVGLLWAGTAQAQLMVGTGGRDKLVGSAQADTIRGLGGPDEMYGNGANDTLDGGGDWDMLDGGPGADKLYGRGGADLLYAGDDSNVDVIVCGPGYDMVYAKKNDRKRGCEEVLSY